MSTTVARCCCYQQLLSTSPSLFFGVEIVFNYQGEGEILYKETVPVQNYLRTASGKWILLTGFLYTKEETGVSTKSVQISGCGVAQIGCVVAQNRVRRRLNRVRRSTNSSASACL
jgi:hypothetical protein